MPKSKTRRKKRRTEKPCRAHPMFSGYLWGEKVDMASKDAIDEIVASSIDLIRMRTSDVEPYSVMHSVLRNIWVGSSLFEDEDKRRAQYLATFCSAMVHIIYEDACRPADKRMIAEDEMPALVQPLNVALEFERAILDGLTRSEVIHMERIGEDFFVKSPHFLVFLFKAPGTSESKVELETVDGRSGFAFIRGEVLHGRIEHRDGAAFWLTDDDRLIRITGDTPSILHKREGEP